MADYSIDFRTRARLSHWNSDALVDAFLHGLADYIEDELVSHDVPPTLDRVIEQAIRIDPRIQACRREKHQRSSHSQLTIRSRGGASSSFSSPDQQLMGPEPMQLGHASLTPVEWE